MQRFFTAIAAAGVFVCASGVPVAYAQTLKDTFAAAYSNNPSLNLARSQLREVDENIALARSGNRPNLFGTIRQSWETTRTIALRSTGVRSAPTQAVITLSQPLFQGFRTRNSIRGATAAVRAQRYSLSNSEQNVLLDTATAFYDVIEDRQIVALRRNDVSFLGAQVRAARDRFEVGEGTRTDISQAEARQARAESALNFEIANLQASEATFRQQTGLDPKRLVDNLTEERFLPASLDSAITIGQNGHPAIVATLYDVDSAAFNVANLEGQFLPSLDLVGEAQTTINNGGGIAQRDSATVRLNLSVPIYQGGRVSAEVRRAKEELGSARIQVDVIRDTIRQFTVESWARYRAALRTIITSRTEVFAAQLALQGVIEEQRVGQRTTLDVLDAQSELIAAQITLVQSERERDVTAYTLISAIGQLNASRLGLAVAIYQPEEHLEAVKDKWFGFRTPDGR
ncbi:MAG: TolC family outer membrane protein [Pseudomonadota bacterium]